MKDVTKYKYYEGGVTVSGVGAETGFAFTRRRRGCFCVPKEGEECSHGDWTGVPDKGVVMPTKPVSAGGCGTRVTRQTRQRGPSSSFRGSIEDTSLLCMPAGDEDDDEEDIWFVNAYPP